jgi:hypothetical protein
LLSFDWHRLCLPPPYEPKESLSISANNGKTLWQSKKVSPSFFLWPKPKNIEIAPMKIEIDGASDPYVYDEGDWSDNGLLKITSSETRNSGKIEALRKRGGIVGLLINGKVASKPFGTDIHQSCNWLDGAEFKSDQDGYVWFNNLPTWVFDVTTNWTASHRINKRQQFECELKFKKKDGSFRCDITQ